MKGAVPAGAKRRWRGLVVAVLGLVLLSMLVPLFFLLHSPLGVGRGYSSKQRSSTSNGLKFFDREGRGNPMNQSEGVQSRHVDDLIRQLAPTLPKDSQRNSSKEAMSKTKGSYVPTSVSKPRPKVNNTQVGAAGRPIKHIQVSDETEKFCELKFGSYCLWRQENRENMKDSIVKKMKDQLYVARAYYPSVAKLPALDKLSHELKQNIQEYERVLSESSTDTDLPPQIEKKLQKMEAAITKAKVLPLDCNNIDKKLRQLVDLTEDEANFHMKQSAFLYQLAVQTTPKSLHCLSMRLTVEYFRSSLDMEQSLADRYLNPELHHYVIFSNNVLASSVVINSTVMHATASANQVFHVLTDKQSFFAMKMWFFKNSYKEAAVQVLNIEDLVVNEHDKTHFFHPILPEEFRVSFTGIDKQSTDHIRTEYLSVFSSSHYSLPNIFPTLKKVVVLDEDVVVQRDLSGLWNIEMNGKVNGAVQTCTVRLRDLKYVFGESNEVNSCAWMSGVNVVDLVRWRELDVTKTFKRLVNEGQQKMEEDGISEAATLRANLLTFRGLVHVLDDTWMLSGLGHNYGLDDESIKKAAVLHFNGNMKPWLELGIANYSGYWRKFLNRENQLLSDCNVNS